MWSSRALLVAAVVCGVGCGSVAREPVDGAVVREPIDGSVVDVPAPAIIYRGHVNEVPSVMFGGGAECMYTMTFQQLDITLGIRRTGDVISGRVQNINVEAIIGPCGHPPAPTVISSYDFKSATPGPAGTIVDFRADAANETKATLRMELFPAGASYSAKLTFHRTDAYPPIDWSVETTVPLAPE